MKVWKISEKSLEQFEECKLGYLWHVTQVHKIQIYHTRRVEDGSFAYPLDAYPPIGSDGITMESWCTSCTRCRGLKEVCDRCHGEVLAGIRIEDEERDVKKKNTI